MSTCHLNLDEALTRLPGPGGTPFVPLFNHGTLQVELYAPSGEDLQTPHLRDEIYVIAKGRAVFFDGVARRPCRTGTFLFVAAGRPHRFEEMSEDFATWVCFYGPNGGESPATSFESPPASE